MTDELENMAPNQRRALDAGLAALDTMAATWAAEVRLHEIAKHFAAIADPDERAKRIAVMVRQGFSEGAYRCFIDHKDQIALLSASKPAAPAQSGELIHQYRVKHCADWHDGHPDRSDGKPYETRIVYAAPQPSQTALVLDDEGAATSRFLFIAMDDDRNAHLTWCNNETDIRSAVQAVMFAPETALCPEDAEMVAGVTDDLLDGGVHSFEGDAPLYLYRVGRAAPQPVAQPVVQTEQSDDARRYQLCRESAIERGLFQTGEEYDAMVDSSLLKNGKEPLTGRGHNYGKKVAKDGSLYRPQLMEQTPAVTLLGDGATTLWRVANAPQAGRGLAFHRPFVLQRQEIGVTVCYCPDGRLKRWKSETEAQRVCNRLNTAIAAVAQPVEQTRALTDEQILEIASEYQTVVPGNCLYIVEFARALLTAARPASGGESC